MYQSKTRRKKANETAKACSKFQRKLDKMKYMIKCLLVKNMLRLEQNRRDHNFISIIKENFPEIYTKTVEISKKEYPNLERLDVLKKELLKTKGG